MSKAFRIAAIAGDGIGKEVLPEGLRVLEQAAKIWGLNLSIEVLDWAPALERAHSQGGSHRSHLEIPLPQ